MKYLRASEQVDAYTAEKTAARDWIKANIRELGEPDEDGNIVWEFDPVPSGDSFCSGLKLQRRVSEYIDEESARALIEDAGLAPRCIRRIYTEEIDLDELYAANQEGLITDEEMDSIIEVDENWALVKIK